MAGGGVALDLAVHSIDIMRYVVGEYANIEGYNSATSCIQMEHEDTANSCLDLKTGARHDQRVVVLPSHGNPRNIWTERLDND